MNSEQPLPSAQLRPRRHWSYLWLLPILCVVIASWLVISALAQRGIPISVQFQQGHGIKPGDALRYRGITVGTVDDVLLADDLNSISVKLMLNPNAEDLARAGSHFWIVRPQLSLSHAAGLETVVGANYLSVLPGEGEAQRTFIGLNRPPPPEVMEPGGLEVVLTTAGRGSLQAGVPVSYRQVIIGTIVTVDLARDSSTVEAHLYIKPQYISLIRENTKFWQVSGTRFNLGFTGVSLDVDSMRSLLLGGINLAIPPDPGKPVAAGHRFLLYDKPESDWLEWKPSLALDAMDSNQERPQLLPAILRWEHKNLFQLTAEEERQAWVLPVAGGLLGPKDILTRPEDALPDSAQLSIAGDPIPFSEAVRTYSDGLVMLPYQHNYPSWSNMRHMTAPEDALVITDTATSARFIGLSRYRLQEPLWTIDPDLPFDARWHGAGVVAEQDGALIGLLLVTEDGVAVARLSGEDKKN